MGIGSGKGWARIRNWSTAVSSISLKRVTLAMGIEPLGVLPNTALKPSIGGKGRAIARFLINTTSWELSRWGLSRLANSPCHCLIQSMAKFWNELDGEPFGFTVQFTSKTSNASFSAFHQNPTPKLDRSARINPKWFRKITGSLRRWSRLWLTTMSCKNEHTYCFAMITALYMRSGKIRTSYSDHKAATEDCTKSILLQHPLKKT